MGQWRKTRWARNEKCSSLSLSASKLLIINLNQILVNFMSGDLVLCLLCMDVLRVSESLGKYIDCCAF